MPDPATTTVYECALLAAAHQEDAVRAAADQEAGRLWQSYLKERRHMFRDANLIDPDAVAAEAAGRDAQWGELLEFHVCLKELAARGAGVGPPPPPPPPA